jgi:hypothetical protein
MKRTLVVSIFFLVSAAVLLAAGSDWLAEVPARDRE